MQVKSESLLFDHAASFSPPIEVRGRQSRLSSVAQTAIHNRCTASSKVPSTDFDMALKATSHQQTLRPEAGMMGSDTPISTAPSSPNM